MATIDIINEMAEEYADEHAPGPRHSNAWMNTYKNYRQGLIDGKDLVAGGGDDDQESDDGLI